MLNLTLAKYAFNIYGNLHPNDQLLSGGLIKLQLDLLIYNCDREVASLSQFALHRYADGGDAVVLGGKNCLKLLITNEDQLKITQEVNLLDQTPQTRGANKVSIINTVKAFGDTIACGHANGVVSVRKVTPLGKAKLVSRYNDHKRTINSLDYIGDENNPSHLILGLQDGLIKLWDLRLLLTKPLLSIVLSSHLDPVRLCQHLPHGGIRNKVVILSVHDLGALCKFDIRAQGGIISGGHSIGPERRWNLHTGPALSLHVHPHREYVITGGRDQKMCVWNYSDAALVTLNRHLSLDYIVNTWGPVMKVRWCQYPSDNRMREDDADEYFSSSLYNYDFACSYLNDDLTILVFNLNRKFIPKEVITTTTGKPVQNFIWSLNPSHQRRVWLVTKANEFISTTLDHLAPEVSLPLTELTLMLMDFDPVGDMAFVNQEKYEFELEDDDVDDVDTMGGETKSLDNMFMNHPVPIKAAALTNLFNVFSSSITPLPVEKPPLLRSNTTVGKTPSPGPFRRGSGHGFTRPKLSRNPLQLTVELGSLAGLPAVHPPMISSKPQNQHRKLIGASYQLPYVIPLRLPLPLNDNDVFSHLATNYLLAPPDGFSLLDACQINASIAVSVNQYRETQMWRILAVSLEDEQFPHGGGVVATYDPMPKPQEPASVVGSYHSNLTTNTNYGGLAIATDHITLLESLARPQPLSPYKHPGRPSFLTQASSSPVAAAKWHPKRFTLDEETIEDGDAPIMRLRQGIMSSTELEDSHQLTPPPQQPERRLFSHQRRPLLRHLTTDDFDNENVAFNHSLHAHPPASLLPRNSPRGFMPHFPLPMSNVHSGSLPHRYSEHLRELWWALLRRNSQLTAPLHHSNLNHHSLDFIPRPGLAEVEEELKSHPSTALLTNMTLELTKAMRNLSMISPPWETATLIRKEVEYCQLLGDIVTLATLVILFYTKYPKTFSKDEATKIIMMYIENLQRRQLFVEATQVIKSTPPELVGAIMKKMPQDVNLRFFCEHCGRVMVNELLKQRFKENKLKEFGFWYCDECRRNQLNCIYCCKPCKGLSVVVSLQCGHRGHFKCLKEWFVAGDNAECPGGCNFRIV